MLLYTIVSYIVLAMLGGLVCLVCYNIINKNRGERIHYIRQFKKGEGIMIYFIVLPLLTIGKLYDKVPFIDAVFTSIPDSLSLVVLKYSFEGVSNLMAALPVFSVAIHVAFVLVLVNAALLTMSIFQQQIWTAYQKCRFQFTKRKKLLLLGYNDENICIYNTEEQRFGMLAGEIPKEDKDKLYVDGIHFFATKNLLKLLKKAAKGAIEEGEECTVVVNTKTDDDNIVLCQGIINFMEEHCKTETQFLQFFHHFKVFVYGDPKLEAIYTSLEDKSKGCIIYLNKYRQIATDFVEQYPFSRFLNEKQLDVNTSLVSKDVDINVVMVGFGKTNRQVFLTSVASNQFLEEREGKIDLKKVNYYMFDRADSRNDKNLNHGYYRFTEELKEVDVNAYLPLPSKPANDEFYFKLDVNDVAFYKSLHKIVGKNPDDVNFFVIAFGDDLANIDLAQKLLEKKQEWKIQNLVLFVKVRHTLTKYQIFDRPDCYSFGIEEQCVYDIKQITKDEISAMAKLRNTIYSIEREMRAKKGDFNLAEIVRKADLEWYIQKTQAERESNIYACLSLRSKLHLIGLDYVKNDDPRMGLTEEEYFAVYAKDDPVQYYTELLGPKKIPKYTLNFPDSLRKTLAIHEHYRWNAYMISKGFLPATKQEILTGKVQKNGALVHSNGRDYSIRTHGNLTTWEGLEEFCRMVAQREGVDELQTDVIKYDYQLLDDAYWLLKEGGYKIIRRKYNDGEVNA